MPSIVHTLDAVARQAPDAVALSWHDNQWTRRDLNDAIASVRATLAERALAKGARVALLLRNSPHYAAAYYGVLAAGLAAVPLNAQERASVLKRQIEHSEASLLIGDPTHPEWSALTTALSGVDCIALQPVDVPGSAAALADQLGKRGSPLRIEELRPEDLATIIYTSGTTGRPKGVMLSHGNLAANAEAIISYLGLQSSDRGMCVLPFHFSYGASVLHSHLLCGAQLMIEDNFAYPRLVLQRLQDFAVTGFAGVPSTFALLLGRCRVGDFDLEHLRYITQAGGPMARPLIERLRAQLPHVRLFVMYGQTEATARLTYLPPEQLETKLGSVGVPIPGVEIEVRGESGGVLAPGEVGELCARGPNVMLGYWRDPEQTASALRDGWLHTGDLGHRDADGYLYIDGRAADMIKVGAFRVSPQEVEEVIASLPGIEEVGVTGMDDELLGQAVKAVIVLTKDSTVDARLVKAHCRAHLAAYKIPKLVEFVAEMPRTSSGKIQRYKLA